MAVETENDREGKGAGIVGNPGAAILLLVAGWLVPGLGHLLQRRWRSALVFFVSVGGLAIIGYMQRGFVFSRNTGDIFDLLGFIADFGAGIFYFAAHWINKAGPDISRAAGDYGTRFIATAGVLNLLCAIDAAESFRKRRARNAQP
jgi:hypothetical protein